MKNLTAAIIILLVTATAHTQVPNGNFEEWVIIDSTEVPKYWAIDDEYCCHHVEKETDAIEGDYSLKLYIHPSNGLIADWLAETTFHAGQLYTSLNASIRIDSMFWGKATAKVLELKNGSYQEIGSWETTDTTNGVERISVPLNQTQTDSLKIQLNAFLVNPSQLPVGYAEMTIDKLELSFSSRIRHQDKPDELFKLYPNPTDGVVHLDFSKVYSIWTVRLYDSKGKLVIESKNASAIDLAGLPTGTYLLTVQADNEPLVTRLIQKK